MACTSALLVGRNSLETSYFLSIESWRIAVAIASQLRSLKQTGKVSIHLGEVKTWTRRTKLQVQDGAINKQLEE